MQRQFFVWPRRRALVGMLKNIAELVILRRKGETACAVSPHMPIQLSDLVVAI
jgi:hypothetical protein